MTSSIGSKPGSSCSWRKCPGTRWVLLFQRDPFTNLKKDAVAPLPLFTVAISTCHVGAGFPNSDMGKDQTRPQRAGSKNDQKMKEQK
jgi:hypothetical protein